MSQSDVDKVREFWNKRASTGVSGQPWNPEPGNGVGVKDKEDKNFDRDGYIRSIQGAAPATNQSDPDPIYNVAFEPGEPDSQYRKKQLFPTGHNIDPARLPPPALPVVPKS